MEEAMQSYMTAMLDMTCLRLQDKQVKTLETIQLQIQLHFDTRHFFLVTWVFEWKTCWTQKSSKGFPFIFGKQKTLNNIFYTLENEHFEPKSHRNWKGKSSRSSEPDLHVFGFHFTMLMKGFLLETSMFKVVSSNVAPWTSHLGRQDSRQPVLRRPLEAPLFLAT